MSGSTAIRAATALLLLVTLAGAAAPCAAAQGPLEPALHAGDAGPSHGGEGTDCHCVCHASWIPVGSAACCGEATPDRVVLSTPSTPEGPALPTPGEPPRTA